MAPNVLVSMMSAPASRYCAVDLVDRLGLGDRQHVDEVLQISRMSRRTGCRGNRPRRNCRRGPSCPSPRRGSSNPLAEEAFEKLAGGKGRRDRHGNLVGFGVRLVSRRSLQVSHPCRRIGKERQGFEFDRPPVSRRRSADRAEPFTQVPQPGNRCRTQDPQDPNR